MFSCIASGVKLLLFDRANFKRLVMQFKSLDILLQLKHILPRVVKSGRLPAKIAACLVSIARLVWLALISLWMVFFKQNIPGLAAYSDNSAIYFKTFC